MNVEDPTLQALVADRKGDRSYEQLAALSDGRLSRARIQQIATREMKAFPDAATLAGLAQALDVPVQEVVLATARSLGLEVRGGASGDALLVPGGKKLSTPAQDALLTMARELSKAGATDGERDAARVDRDAQRDGVTRRAAAEQEATRRRAGREQRDRVRSALQDRLLAPDTWPGAGPAPIHQVESILDVLTSYGVAAVESEGEDEAEALDRFVEQTRGLFEHLRIEGELSPEQASSDPEPWKQDDYALAAKRGRNRGREARQQQDREAEDGGA